MPVGRDNVHFVKEMDELNILTRADGKGLGHVVREPSSFAVILFFLLTEKCSTLDMTGKNIKR